jgi:hypothetical protein
LIEQTLQGAGDAQSILVPARTLRDDAAGEKLSRMEHHVSTNENLIPT